MFVAPRRQLGVANLRRLADPLSIIFLRHGDLAPPWLQLVRPSVSIYNSIRCVPSYCVQNTALGGHLSRAAQGPKFKIPLPRSFVPGHIQYVPSFIDVGPAVSEPWGFETVDTTRTDGHLTGFTMTKN